MAKNKAKSKRAKKMNLWLTNNSQLVITFKPKPSRAKSRAKVKRLNIKAVKRPLKKAVHLPRVKINRQLLSSVVFVLIGLAGTVYFGLSIRQTEDLQPTNQFSLQAPTIKSKGQTNIVVLKPSKPTHISIPSVGINANIEPVGKLPNGTMQTPSDPYMTGWYKYSPTPGEIGPAIIVGHVDWTKIGPVVFWRLRDLKPGDKIIVTRGTGRKLTFKVTGLQQFEQDAFPTKKVYGNINYQGLRLITCGGTFNYSSGHYSHNTVVFAQMINKTS